MSSESDIVDDLMPGQVIRNRNRLWRVDDITGDIVAATPIDGNIADKHRFYAPIENIERGDLPKPDPDQLGSPQIQR